MASRQYYNIYWHACVIAFPVDMKYARLKDDLILDSTRDFYVVIRRKISLDKIINYSASGLPSYLFCHHDDT